MSTRIWTRQSVLAVALLLAACISDSQPAPRPTGREFQTEGNDPGCAADSWHARGRPERRHRHHLNRPDRRLQHVRRRWKRVSLVPLAERPDDGYRSTPRKFENTGITALAISDAGHIVGYAPASDGVPGGSSIGAFLWKDGSFTALGQNCVESYAAAVNTKGQVAGVCSSIPVIWQNGTPTNLGSLGGRGKAAVISALMRAAR